MLRRVYPFVETTNTQVEVKAWLTDDAAGQLHLAGTYTYNGLQPEGGHFVSVFHRGRFASIQYGSPTGEGWVLDGHDYDATPGGKR